MAGHIPNKIYFKIGEVSEIVGVKAHVLRYWEEEFPSLNPVKSRANQRLYRREDIEQALLIKSLLYQQGFTVGGARQQLKKSTVQISAGAPSAVDLDTMIERLRCLRNRLLSDEPEKKR